ncbi:hypothetical protein ACFWQ6_00825 [Streptomyces coelicoflavus]|uniref:hypothetical protein n=1 Tax=Streptomyces coelicoflavus TaxID=285562 RepID=UPI003646D0A2
MNLKKGLLRSFTDPDLRLALVFHTMTCSAVVGLVLLLTDPRPHIGVSSPHGWILMGSTPVSAYFWRAKAHRWMPAVRAAMRRPANSAVDSVVSVAATVAGRRRPHLRDEWLAHLAGAPEQSVTLTTWQRQRTAAGFLISAVRMRTQDLTRPLWRPVDWLLSSESRTRTVVTLAVGGQIVYIQKNDGLYGLLTEGWGWCAGCAVALHFFFRWLRTIRGVELAVPDSRAEER